MSIRLIEGLHLTPTNKRHLAEIIEAGWTQGHSSRINYTVAPIEERPGCYRYSWSRRETSDFGRQQTREGRGIIEYVPSTCGGKV